MTSLEFNAQLDALEKALIAQYKQKILMMAARESLRFQYATSQRAKWNALSQVISGLGFTQPNSNGSVLLSSILSNIQGAIPMTDMDGVPSQGWLGLNPGNAGSGGGAPNAGFLSPLENLILKPFNKASNPDQRPAYKIYGKDFLSASTLASLMPYIFPDNRLKTTDRVKGGTIPFSIPPSLDWCINFYYNTPTIKNYLAASYQYAADILSQTYAPGSVAALVQEFKSLFDQIVTQTQNVIALQRQIDVSETDLSNFVGTFKEFGSTLNLAQILLDLQTAAQLAAYPPPPPPPPPPVLVSVIEPPPAPLVLAEIPVVAPPASKLPWIAAAAVLGVMVMGSKK